MKYLIIKLYALFFDFVLFVKISAMESISGNYIISRPIRFRSWQRCRKVDNLNIRFISPPKHLIIIDSTILIKFNNLDLEAL